MKLAQRHTLEAEIESLLIASYATVAETTHLTDQQRNRKAIKARTDFNAFMEYCFIDTVTMSPVKQGKIHRKWDRHIAKHDRALILAPREHGKTEQIAIGRAMWELGKAPNLRVKIVCQDDGTAIKRLSAVKLHIESNPLIRDVFPNLRQSHLVDNWAKQSITVEREGQDKDPSVEALGVLSTGTGGRVDLFIFDDVVDFRNAIAQPALRPLIIETFENVWINLMAKGSRAIYIATPWHKDDLTSNLEESGNWAVLKMPIPEDFKPIWSEQWSQARLMRRKREIGNRAFNRGFHLIAQTDEDKEFPSFDSCIHPEYELADIPGDWKRIAGVDLGHSKRKRAIRRGRTEGKVKPRTVIFVLAVDPDTNKRWPCEIRMGHWSGPSTADYILEVNEWHDPDMWIVENNAYQDTLGDWVVEKIDNDPRWKGAIIRWHAFTTGKNKADEEVGLPALAAEFDNSAWIIPTNGGTIEQMGANWAVWANEMRNYGITELSDSVMACWFAKEGCRLTGRAIMISSEELDDAEDEIAQRIGGNARRLSAVNGNGRNGHSNGATNGEAVAEWDASAYQARRRRYT